MQHTPHIDVVWVLDVEHEVRVARQRPSAQARQVDLMGVARRSVGGVATDMPIGPLQRIDKAECHGLACFTQVVGDRLIHIPVGLLTRDDGLDLHALAAGSAALRTRSRRPSK